MVQEQETTEQTLVIEGNPPQPEAGAATPSTPAIAPPSPDFAKENAQLKEELALERSERAKETQARRSAEGRLNAADRKTILTAQKMAERTLSEEDRAAAAKEAADASDAEELHLRAVSEIGEGVELLREYAAEMGKTYETDPAFADIRDRYGKGLYLSAARGMKALHKTDGVGKRQAEQEAAAAEVKRKATLREGLAAATPRPAAASINVTRENIDALYVQGKVPDDKYRAFIRTGEL